MIDLRTGVAVKTWNMIELLNKEKQFISSKGEQRYDWGNAVLNGIAYQDSNDSFIISGKLWDFIYEVKLDYRKYMKE